MKINITDTARLPFKVVQGTEKERYKLSAKISKNFFKELEKIMPNNECTVEEYKTLLDSFLAPYKIDYDVLENTNKKFAGSVAPKIEIIEQDGTITVNKCGFKIYLPMTDSKKIRDKYTVLHETGHVFDHIVNPKSQRIEVLRLFDNQGLAEKFNRFKEDFVYSLKEPIILSKFKKAMSSRLKEIPTNEAKEVLLQIRNCLKTERQQYLLELKAMMKSPFENLDKIYNRILFMISNAKFKSRLKFANKLLKETLLAAKQGSID